MAKVQQCRGSARPNSEDSPDSNEMEMPRMRSNSKGSRPSRQVACSDVRSPPGRWLSPSASAFFTTLTAEVSRGASNATSTKRSNCDCVTRPVVLACERGFDPGVSRERPGRCIYRSRITTSMQGRHTKRVIPAMFPLRPPQCASDTSPDSLPGPSSRETSTKLNPIRCTRQCVCRKAA